MNKKQLNSYESCSYKAEPHKVKDCPRFVSDVDEMIEDLQNYGCPEELSEAIAVGLVQEIGWKK